MKNAHFSPNGTFPQSYAAVQIHVLAQREDQEGSQGEGQDYFFPPTALSNCIGLSILRFKKAKNITNYFNYYFIQ